MAGLTGGTVYDVYNKRNAAWKPAGPVVDEWQYYTANPSDAYVCLGVVGDTSHWEVKNGGDHTSRSTHDSIAGGKTVWPLAGWVYAVDGRVPEPEKFEKWLLGEVKAGKYPHIKYWNINFRHYNVKTGWKASSSPDGHLHLSFMPGYEHGDSTILADYERHRTGKPAPAPPAPKPVPTPPGRPVLSKGAKNAWVGRLQGLLVGHGHALVIDRDFGPKTYAAVRAFQTGKKITIDGVVGAQTWAKLVAALATVRRGSKGLPVGLAQGLLVAAGYDIGRRPNGQPLIDRDFGARTDTATRAFQGARKLTVDGIVGPATTKRLVDG